MECFSWITHHSNPLLHHIPLNLAQCRKSRFVSALNQNSLRQQEERIIPGLKTLEGGLRLQRATQICMPASSCTSRKFVGKGSQLAALLGVQSQQSTAFARFMATNSTGKKAATRSQTSAQSSQAPTADEVPQAEPEAPSRSPLRLVVKDAVKRWFNEAHKEAAKGDVKQQALLGQMLIEGYGCKQNPELGREWTDKARRRGYKMAGVYCEL